MRARRQSVCLEPVELGQNKARVPDCIHSQVVAASVSRAADELDLGPYEAPMRGADRKARGFGEDRGCGSDATREERVHAEALVLLVCDGGNDDFVAGICAGFVEGLKRGCAHRGDTGFHVCRTAPVDAPVLHIAFEGLVRHPFDADRIEMSREQERVFARGSDARDEIGSAWRGFLKLDLEAPVREDAGERFGYMRFAGGSGAECGIAGIDPRERPGERRGIASLNLQPGYFRFFGAGFFVAGFFAAGFFAAGFFAAGFFGAGFFAAGFFAAGFF